MEKKIQAVISKTFGLTDTQALTAEMGNPPNWDSLGHMQLIVALEKEFSIRFPSHTIQELTNQKSIANVISKLANKQNE